MIISPCNTVYMLCPHVTHLCVWVLSIKSCDYKINTWCFIAPWSPTWIKMFNPHHSPRHDHYHGDWSRYVPFCTVPKTLQLKTLDSLQQTITMNKNAQWQMIKDSVLFALSWGFSVSLFHFYLKKKLIRGVHVHCIVLYFFFFLVASITLFATRVLFILEIV